MENMVLTSFFYEKSSIKFLDTRSKPVLTITPDGRLELGEGASPDEATRVLFDCMAQSYGTMVHDMKKDNERLREAVNLLLPHAISWQSYINTRISSDTVNEAIFTAHLALKEGE